MFPEKYDGNGDWEEYVKHFEDVAMWNDWSASEQATQLRKHVTEMARGGIHNNNHESFPS